MLVVTALVLGVARAGRAEQAELAADWLDSEWEHTREGRFSFPTVQECQGERLELGPGETALLTSHRSLGTAGYAEGYRCRWVLQPLQCDLSLVRITVS